MPRASWKGFIRLSLVSVPVEGYSASAAGETQIALNQLHDECHGRIRYKKVCETHGEVAAEQIVMGYEFDKGHYVVVDPAELQKLRTPRDYSINVDRFVEPSTIDATYFAGKTYYLLPHGKLGEKPYALLNRAMAQEKVYGLAQVVVSNREQLVALRPIGRLLAISMLQYAAHLRTPQEFEAMLRPADVSAEELKLARMLIDATRQDEPQLEQYEDLYQVRLKSLIEARVEGKQLTAPNAVKPPVINFVDAIRESIKQTVATSKGRKKPASASRAKAPPKRRKTG